MKKALLYGTLFLCILMINNLLLFHFHIDPRIRAGLERNSLWEAERHLQKTIEQCAMSVVSIEDDKNRILGSGFFITQFGHILTTTSFHASRRQIFVRLSGVPDEPYPAQLLHYDSKNKIVLLKIEYDNSRRMSFAKYNTLKAGSFTLALGNPAASGLIIEPGVIKRDYSPASSSLFIETGSVINHANNGGPLIDARGKVIGVNLMIFQGQQNPRNVFYVIPLEQIRETLAPFIDINEYI